MDISHFINNLKNVLEDTDPALLTHDGSFKDLEEWNSLIALSVIAMVDEEYDVKLKGDDIRNSNTIQELYDVVHRKALSTD
jgi:acyl carrier protein